MSNVIGNTAPLGMYVMFKDSAYIVVNFNEDVSKLTLLNPLDGNKKRVVLASNTTPLSVTDAVTVQHQYTNYLRTVKGCIISLTTGRVMQWADNDANRVAILTAV